jgi:hypothetical protein
MRTRLALLAVAVLLFLAGFWSGQRGPLAAQAQDRRTRDISVPKSWGVLRGAYYDQLLFEDDRGVIRSVYPNGGAVVFTVTRR